MKARSVSNNVQQIKTHVTKEFGLLSGDLGGTNWTIMMDQIFTPYR